MPEDFRVKVGFFTHPKTVKLRRILGPGGPLALLQLIGFCAENTSRSTGDLSGMDVDDIEIAAGWVGDRLALTDALAVVGYLDGMQIHDFEEHNPWVAGAQKRSEKARRAARSRWGNADSKSSNTGSMKNDAPSMKNDASGIENGCPVSISISNTNTTPDTSPVSLSPLDPVDWEDGDPITSTAEMLEAASRWGWSIDVASKARAKVKRITTAGAITHYEIEDARRIAEAAPLEPRNRVSYFLGCVETGRRDAAGELSKDSPAPRSRPEHSQEYLEWLNGPEDMHDPALGKNCDCDKCVTRKETPP